MTLDPFDLFVIGAGSGGVRAARLAARQGAKVAVADPAPPGGTCVNLGCIPKKLYSFAAHYAGSFDESRGFGWSLDAPPRFDWETLKARRAREIARLNGLYSRMLEESGVALLRGSATLRSAGEVEVNGRLYGAKHVLIASGGRPVVPVFPGHDLAMTSNEVFDLREFPSRLIVVGGGYIASEFASIFAGLGAQVIQLYRGEQILRGFDDDVRHFVAAEMAKKRISIRTRSDISHIERAADGALRATLADGSRLEADTILYATGRQPNTEGIGLSELGVELAANGAIVVDEVYRSSVPGIHALGDVIGRAQLTPVALAEAMAFIDHLFGAGKRKVDYRLIPTAVFTDPSIGTIGLTERDARQCFQDVRVFRSEFKALRHTLSGSSERTLMKLVVDGTSDRVIGLHMVGADAGEIVQGFGVAMTAGATKSQFDMTIGIHPTVAEEFVSMREPVG
ncbi:glutathione-disulfide reductase [Methylibium sp.]|uniref:glutathione-disulfide reductase n=1 Tax=Methylibium sp. TaxID=2067992 RepID=UPI003D0EB1EE